MTKKTLIDLGEREILRTIIPRFANGIGDDCALISLPSGTLVATTDPVPPPAARSIGLDDDPFWAGWLLVTINASDLAASGARPLGFLAAIECERDFPVEKFERVLAGVRASCDEAGLLYAGGNIREASCFSAVGVALGICHPYRPIRREGARPGDFIVSIGSGGIFWRDALRLFLHKQPVEDKNSSPVYQPRSQISIMAKLAEANLINAAMDNSDGLLPSLAELSEKSRIGVELYLDNLDVPQVVAAEGLEPARLWLGWGDWNVITAISPENFEAVRAISENSGGSAIKIGMFTSDRVGVHVCRAGRSIPAPRLESERFSRDSWMSSGIEGYVKLLQKVPLP
ncbi:MAG: thiamine-monophosphate kinase [Rhodospirillales bacterium]|nr:thiamine-monophosphate kinase [Rhodospirillales bacterium]